MRFYIITDTHLGHKNIEKYCNRPPGFEEIILNSIRGIKKQDILIHLGDICMSKPQHWNEVLVSQSECTKWLLKGNHDSKSYNWYLEHGWDVVAKTITTCIEGRVLTFSHAPLETFLGLNVHGHQHNTKRASERHFPISIEGYYMVRNLKEVF